MGGLDANHVARWDGSVWQTLGTGVDEYVEALTTFDPDGAGPQSALLIAGGAFTFAGGAEVSKVATWDGGAWQPLGLGMDGVVFALATFEPEGVNPQPPQLIAGGTMQFAGQVILNRIGRWNGTSWQPLGTGMNSHVFALTTFTPDGAGPQPSQLIAAGNFTTAGEVAANRIARWDGTAWHTLGTGLNSAVYALTTFDPDGAAHQPAQLIAAGLFTSAGGVTANRIARWDGSTWQPLGAGMNFGVRALTTFDPDGDGPQASQLIAAGNFTTAGGVAADRIARWDGSAWHPVGKLVDGSILALTTFDPDGDDRVAFPRLCVGGYFTQAGSQVSAYFAQWGNDSALWKAASSGTYGASANWLCNVPPTAFDRLFIDRLQAGYPASSFQISLPVGGGPTTARTLSVRTDTVTLDLNGNPFTLTGGSSSVDDPGVIVGELASEPGALILKNSLGGAQVGLTTSSLSLADQPTSATRLNSVTVQDAGTCLVVNGQAFIGRRGNEGRLTVQSGGFAGFHGPFAVADQVGSVGKVNVTGAGSLLIWDSAYGGWSSVGIGVNGTATLDVSSGAVASSAGLQLGDFTFGTLAGGFASVNITGAGTIWATEQRNFSIGYAGDAVFGIQGGGQMYTSTSFDVYVSRFSEAVSTVTLRDNGSRWIEEVSPIRIGPAGTIDVGPGTAVECPAMVVTEGGFLTGEGIVRALTPGGLMTLSNGGTVSPRSVTGTPAVLTIEGNLTQSAARDGITTAGTIAADLAGTAPGQADRIDFTGTAALSGALRVRLISGFDPPAGTRFTVLTAAGGITGRFDVAYFPGLAGRFFRIDYITGSARTPASVDVVVESQSERGTFSSSGYTAPGAPSAAALGNLDADSFVDLVLAVPDGVDPEANPGQIAVLLNDGTTGPAWNGFVPSGQVTVNTGRYPSGLALGSFRGAGQPVDIAVTNAADDSVQLFSNSGAAVFTAGTPFGSGGLRPLAIDAADLNADGVPELAVANYGDIDPPPEIQLPDRGNARVLVNSGTGTFTLGAALSTGWYPQDIAVLDADGDGRGDLATADSGTNEVSIFLHAPGNAPNYLPPTRYPVVTQPVHVEPGGLDNPKDLEDLAVVSIGNGGPGAGSVSILVNLDSPTGVFAPAVALNVEATPRDLTVIDLDNDGDQDLGVITDGAAPGTSVVRLLRNTTVDGAAGLALALEPGALAANNPSLLLSGDVDNDTLEDLIAINAGTGALMRRAGASVNALAGGEERGNPPEFVSVARAVAPPEPCPADISNPADGVINTADLTALLGTFGQTVTPGTAGDITGDGLVNTADLVTLLGVFGQVCP